MDQRWTSTDLVTVEGVIIAPRQILRSLLTNQQYEVLDGNIGGLWIAPTEDGRTYYHMAFCIEVNCETFSYVSHPEK